MKFDKPAIRFFRFLVGAVLTVLWATGLFAQEPEPAGNVSEIDRLTQEILSVFQTGEVRITRVVGDTAYLTATSPLTPGMRISVYRPGIVYHHPVTGEPFGQGEQQVGHAEVTRVFGREAKARLLDGEARSGDVARRDATTVRAGLAYDDDVPSGAVDALYESLDEQENISVRDFGSGPAEEHLQRALAEEADAVIHVSGGPTGSTARLFLVPGPGTPVAAWPLRLEAEAIDLGNTPADRGILDTPVPWFHFKLPFQGHLVAAGDIDGDGVENILVADRNRIRVYTIDKHDLREINDVRLPTQARLFSLAASDIDGDGRAEIVATAADTEGRGLTEDDDMVPATPERINVDTWVYGFEPSRGFEKRWQTSGLFSRGATEGVYLQGYQPSRGISGPLYRLVWNGKGFTKEPVDDVPPGPNLYGFTRVGRSFVLVAGDGHLAASDAGGKVFWKSPDRFGGGETELNLPSTIFEDQQKILRTVPPVLKKEGSRQFFAFQNILYASVVPGAGVKSSRLTGFLLENDGAKTLWEIRDLAARAMDLTPLTDGRLAVLIAPTLKGSEALFGSWAFLKSRSSLMVVDTRRQ